MIKLNKINLIVSLLMINESGIDENILIIDVEYQK